MRGIGGVVGVPVVSEFTPDQNYQRVVKALENFLKGEFGSAVLSWSVFNHLNLFQYPSYCSISCLAQLFQC